jgi:hypothetical protein
MTSASRGLVDGPAVGDQRQVGAGAADGGSVDVDGARVVGQLALDL